MGQIAKRQAVVNPENTFFSVKRFIGRKMSEVDEESKQVSYRVVRDENGNVKLDCPAIGKQFAAEEISAQVYFVSLIPPLASVKPLVYIRIKIYNSVDPLLDPVIGMSFTLSLY